MDSNLLVAAITGLTTVLGSAVTGLITYLVVRRQDELTQLRRALRRALQDVAAFHRLEAAAVACIAEHEAHNTPDAIKRRLRRSLRDQGHDTPSHRATEHSALQALNRLPEA